ncbi:hypothetical protein [Acetonema longum]|uniref:Uncharacterized protein n=1 Tax=Acetonema longum DSM 6540 TaxID=1009370 RepID=F7NKE1_9FIRM|nr:hypothetical protein [Acetonema longum]EGO63582.1 hypothetical protein ALO_12771 [Acetonema longum DSM 6540]
MNEKPNTDTNGHVYANSKREAETKLKEFQLQGKVARGNVLVHPAVQQYHFANGLLRWHFRVEKLA